MPRISIIICTYNREKFLADSLHSVAAQDAPKEYYELVIVNNNCTDNTDAIVRKFMAAHPQLQTTYVTEIKQGLSHARNRGIQEAKGDNVSFIDDDAIAESNFVSGLLHFFDAHSEAVAVGGPILAKYESQAPIWANRYSISMFTGHYVRGDQPFRYTNLDYPRGSNMTMNKAFLAKHDLFFDPELGRKGKDGAANEEKELFAAIRRLGGAVYYEPGLVVHHQVDDYRLELPYLVKLSKGLGRSQYVTYRQRGWLHLLIPLSIILFKLGAGILLGIGYLLKGRPSVFRHLFQFRWYVLMGFLGR